METRDLEPRRLSRTTRFHLVAIGSALAAALAVSCSPRPSSESNLATGPEEANALLEARLHKTEEVRATLRRVSDALRPVEDVLRDISDAIDLKVDGRPGLRVQTFLRKLQVLLRESTQGLVDQRPDGSWVAERTVRLDPTVERGCADRVSVIRLHGRRTEGRETVTLSVRDCALRPNDLLVEVADIAYDPVGDELSFRFLPPRIETALRVEHSEGACRLSVSGQDAELHCDPFFAGSARFSRLDVASTGGRLEAHAFAWLEYRLENDSTPRFASAAFDLQPGGHPALDIRTGLDRVE